MEVVVFNSGSPPVGPYLAAKGAAGALVPAGAPCRALPEVRRSSRTWTAVFLETQQQNFLSFLNLLLCENQRLVITHRGTQLEKVVFSLLQKNDVESQ